MLTMARHCCERRGTNKKEWNSWAGFRNFQTSHFPEGIISVGDELIRAYIRTGMPDRISSIYSLYTETSDSLRHRARANAAIGANVRYETGRKEQENLVLAAEVSLKQRTLIFYPAIGRTAVCHPFSLGGMYMRQRQRFPSSGQ